MIGLILLFYVYAAHSECPKNEKEWEDLRNHFEKYKSGELNHLSTIELKFFQKKPRIDQINSQEFSRFGENSFQIINNIQTCLENYKDPFYVTCQEQWMYELEELKSYYINSSFQYPISDDEYFNDNAKAIGLESIPEVLKSQNFLEGIIDPNKVDETVEMLTEQLKDKDPIIFTNDTIHNQIEIDGSNRLVVNINDQNCNRTFIITKTSKNEHRSPHGQFAQLAICHRNPQTGEKLEKPIQFLADYWRETNQENQVTIKYRQADKTTSCISCHSKGPILMNSDKNSPHISKQDLDLEQKLNARYRTFSKAEWASYDSATGKYINLFNSWTRKSRGVPWGPILPKDDPGRNLILDNCIPNANYLNKFRNTTNKNGQKRLRTIIQNAMNCTSCHNKYDQGELFHSSNFETRNPVLGAYFLDDKMKHEMPPGLTDEFDQEDSKKIKKILLGCLDLEINGKSNLEYTNFDDLLKYLTKSQFESLPNSGLGGKLFKSNSNESRCEQPEDYFKSNLSTNKDENCFESPSIIPRDFVKDNLTPIFGNQIGKERNKVLLISDPLQKEIGTFQNNYLICNKNKIFYPIQVTPPCNTGSCNPFQVTLEFNTSGEFLGFSEKFCPECSKYPLQKYGHVELNKNELRDLSNYLKESSNDDQNFSAYFPKKLAIDALSGATQIAYPVPGMGESTYVLSKYSKEISLYIKSFNGEFCHQ